MIEDTTTGDIKHFAADSTFVPHEPYLPGAEAGQIWLALHNKQQDFADPCLPPLDALTEKERALYDALTAKFTLDASMQGFSCSVIEPKENQDG